MRLAIWRKKNVSNRVRMWLPSTSAPVAALLRRAAGAVALDDEELALCRVALLAVGELARQVGDVERALAPGQVARFARRFARRRGLDDLGDDLPGIGRVLLE